MARAGALIGLLTGCAAAPGADPRDPWEAYNRSMTDFNDGVDRVLLKPAATVYREVLPRPVRTGVNNFFANLAEPWVAANAALQLKGQATLETLMRFSVNTVLGLAGVLDIATEAGIERRNEDFGQTLGYWGVAPGPFVVLPFFGPTTVRDGSAMVVDFQGDILLREPNLTTRDSAALLRLIDFRTTLLRAGEIIDEGALDRYSFTRDVYLQRRQSLVSDGQEAPETPVESAK